MMSAPMTAVNPNRIRVYELPCDNFFCTVKITNVKK